MGPVSRWWTLGFTYIDCQIYAFFFKDSLVALQLSKSFVKQIKLFGC